VNTHRVIIVSVLLGLAPLLAGCGKGSSVKRLPVHGTVTLASGEAFSGSITFRPADGQGPAAGATVDEGSYQFDRDKGPTAGPQTVIMRRAVSRSRTPDKKQAVQKYKQGLQQYKAAQKDKQAIPKSEGEWTDSRDVADDGQYEQNFTLKD
jgi:hypothetical protein